MRRRRRHGALRSAFLDTAPTHLVSLDLAGEAARDLITAHAGTLMAIATGAVRFGALTYTGNVPFFMIKAMAEDRGVPMPGFFGFVAKSGGALLPLLALIGGT